MVNNTITKLIPKYRPQRIQTFKYSSSDGILSLATIDTILLYAEFQTILNTWQLR